MTPFFYRFTSLARALDPRIPTNLAVLVLMPLVGGGAALQAWLQGAAWTPLGLAGGAGALALLGTWALARELSVDRPIIAFISAGFGVLWIFLGLEGWSLLLLFAALFQVRLVNRTVGLPATVADGFVVLGFSLAALWVTESPLVWGTGVLAFGLDASLSPRAHRSWFFAALCVGGGLYFDLGAALFSRRSLRPGAWACA